MCSATTAFEIGQRGRICTCGHPVPSRACCCYTTRCSPRPVSQAGGRGLCCCRNEALFPGTLPRGKMALSMGLAPTLFPQTTGCFAIQLRERKGPAIHSLEPDFVGSAGNAPVRRFRHIFCDARFTVEQPEHLPNENDECLMTNDEIRSSNAVSHFGNSGFWISLVISHSSFGRTKNHAPP